MNGIYFDSSLLHLIPCSSRDDERTCADILRLRVRSEPHVSVYACCANVYRGSETHLCHWKCDRGHGGDETRAQERGTVETRRKRRLSALSFDNSESVCREIAKKLLATSSTSCQKLLVPEHKRHSRVSECWSLVTTSSGFFFCHRR